MKSLSKKEINKVLKDFPQWKLDSNATKLTRIFTFEKHIDALIFIARSTVNAEVMKHQPDITFTYCKVKMAVTTHDLKGLTKNDINLIKKIEQVSQKVDKK